MVRRSGVDIVIHILKNEFGPEKQEREMKAITDYFKSRRLPGESIDSALARYDTVFRKAQHAGLGKWGQRGCHASGHLGCTAVAAKLLGTVATMQTMKMHPPHVLETCVAICTQWHAANAPTSSTSRY